MRGVIVSSAFFTHAAVKFSGDGCWGGFVMPRKAALNRGCSENGVTLAQKMQVGPCIPVGMQL